MSVFCFSIENKFDIQLNFAANWRFSMENARFEGILTTKSAK